MGTYVVVVGGGSLTRPPQVECGSTVIAVDSGLDVALAAGLAPTLVVGDLDSVSAGALADAVRRGIRVDAHPTDKDATDTALALHAATTLARDDPAPRLRVICGIATDRLDHVLGILAAMGADELSAFLSISAHIGDTDVHVLHAGRAVTLDIAAGRLFSLLALHGRCTGVDVVGARWPLADATLESSTTVGISNEAQGVPVTVRCGSGVLTVVLPEAAS